ncbi:hypothetical protein K456DRAFT_40882 [Colletotrichum gloeosporioides 23]|nr:hypothetical protein K456DRAFT_40882 [Colletotrichum gloeosporioides 23]
MPPPEGRIPGPREPMLRALTRAASVQLRPGSSIGHLPDRRLKTKASNLDSRRKPYAAFIACGSCQILSIGVRTPRIILSLCRWLLRRSSRRVPKWVSGARLRLQPPSARVRVPASELPTAGSSEQDFQNSSARPQQQSGWSPRNRLRWLVEVCQLRDPQPWHDPNALLTVFLTCLKPPLYGIFVAERMVLASVIGGLG